MTNLQVSLALDEMPFYLMPIVAILLGLAWTYKQWKYKVNTDEAESIKAWKKARAKWYWSRIPGLALIAWSPATIIMYIAFQFLAGPDFVEEPYWLICSSALALTISIIAAVIDAPQKKDYVDF